MGRSNERNLVPKTASCWVFRRKVVPKTVSCWAFGEKVVPKTALCWTFGGKVVPKTASFLQTCMSNWISSTRCPLFSVFETETETETLYLTVFPLPLFTVSFCKHPQEQTPLLSNTQTEANVTHSLAPVDTTAQGIKKQSSKKKGEFTFSFSSAIFNFLWVDTMIGLSLWNILTLVHVS